MSLLFNTYQRDAKALRIRYVGSRLIDNPQLSPFDIARFYSGGEPGQVPPSQPTDRLKIDYDTNLWDRAIPVASIEAAEQLYLDMVTPETVEFHKKPGCCGLSLSQIPIMVNRRANIIASRTRRAAGNTALMGRKALSQMIDATAKDGFIQPLSNAGLSHHRLEIESWTWIGKLNDLIDVYTHDSFPTDECAVIYKGSADPDVIDAGAGLLVDGDEMRLYILEESPEYMGNAAAYLQRFIVKIEG